MLHYCEGRIPTQYCALVTGYWLIIESKGSVWPSYEASDTTLRWCLPGNINYGFSTSFSEDFTIQQDNRHLQEVECILCSCAAPTLPAAVAMCRESEGTCGIEVITIILLFICIYQSIFMGICPWSELEKSLKLVNSGWEWCPFERFFFFLKVSIFVCGSEVQQAKKQTHINFVPVVLTWCCIVCYLELFFWLNELLGNVFSAMSGTMVE